MQQARLKRNRGVYKCQAFGTTHISASIVKYLSCVRKPLHGEGDGPLWGGAIRAEFIR
jgi:hypothetical protein